MNPEDKIVWEAWGAVQQFASTPDAPPRLREIVAEYRGQISKARTLLRAPITTDGSSFSSPHINKPRGIA